MRDLVGETHRWLPTADAALVIGVGGGRHLEIPPLRDILVSLLPPDLDLLLLPAAAKVVRLEAALALVL